MHLTSTESEIGASVSVSLTVKALKVTPEYRKQNKCRGYYLTK